MESLTIFGEDTWFSRHALEMTHEDHKAVILEHNEVQKRVAFALHGETRFLELFPNAYSDESEVNGCNNKVCEHGTKDSTFFENQPHLFILYLFNKFK